MKFNLFIVLLIVYFLFYRHEMHATNTKKGGCSFKKKKMYDFFIVSIIAFLVEINSVFFSPNQFSTRTICQSAEWKICGKTYKKSKLKIDENKEPT